jgi:tRNA pseudouridine38-40 synthase
MARIAIGIEYDGSAYSGWQAQGHARSVQAELEAALARVADHPVALTAAGRTDAGVHALAQVAHFDSDAPRPLLAWVFGTNAWTPNDISVLWSREVSGDFHARFSAVSRTYVYRILSRPIRPALDRQRVCWRKRELDADRMHLAAQALLGEHDFSAFRAAECQSRSPTRRVEAIDVTRSGDEITIEIRANAFLHHMVRNVAGSLLAVGCGDRPVEWIAEVLAGRDRTRAGVTAPPAGLYFAGVEYPPGFGLPAARHRLDFRASDREFKP